MQNAIKQTWHFDQAPEEVWEYLTRPELLEHWLGKMDFQPFIGHKFHIAGKGGCLIYCEVSEVNPFSRLSYSWQTTSLNDNKLFDSTVVWTLVPKENGTELQLVHDGFTTIEDFNSHNNGWTTLGKLFVELSNTITK
jgi:uncharacterized protein YndB with AHSA1/START domain